MTKNRIAIIPAKGVGDALLFSILANNAKKSGARVTIFHRFADELRPILNEEFSVLPELPERELEGTLSEFTVTYFQNDHSALAYKLHSLRKNELGDIRFILPKPSPLYKNQDIELNPLKTMVENLCDASFQLFGRTGISNGSPLFQTWNGQSSRLVYLHPFSGSPLKNWTLARYIELAKRLEKKGFSPVFLCKEEDAEKLQTPFSHVICGSLQELASLLRNAHAFVGNDSGPGHLASLIGVPTITVGGNSHQLKLWKPGWAKNILCTPHLPLPNFKGIGLTVRDHYWQYFVSVQRIVQAVGSL